MTQDHTPAERSKRAESAQRVVVRHRGRDYPMTRAAYGRLLDRVAARVKATGLSAAEQSLVAKAGWDAPATGTHASLTSTEHELLARAGWAD